MEIKDGWRRRTRGEEEREADKERCNQKEEKRMREEETDEDRTERKGEKKETKIKQREWMRRKK